VNKDEKKVITLVDIINIGKIVGAIVAIIAAFVLFNSMTTGHIKNETRHLSPVEKTHVQELPVLEDKVQNNSDRVLMLEVSIQSIENTLKKQDDKLDKILLKLE